MAAAGFLLLARRLGALGARLLWAAWRLLTSMRFAIALLLVIAVASVIGTLLPQQQPYSVYAGLYGAFGRMCSRRWVFSMFTKARGTS